MAKYRKLKKYEDSRRIVCERCTTEEWQKIANVLDIMVLTDEPTTLESSEGLVALPSLSLDKDEGDWAHLPDLSCLDSDDDDGPGEIDEMGLGELLDVPSLDPAHHAISKRVRAAKANLEAEKESVTKKSKLEAEKVSVRKKGKEAEKVSVTKKGNSEAEKVSVTKKGNSVAEKVSVTKKGNSVAEKENVAKNGNHVAEKVSVSKKVKSKKMTEKERVPKKGNHVAEKVGVLKKGKQEAEKKSVRKKGKELNMGREHVRSRAYHQTRAMLLQAGVSMDVAKETSEENICHCPSVFLISKTHKALYLKSVVGLCICMVVECVIFILSTD